MCETKSDKYLKLLRKASPIGDASDVPSVHTKKVRGDGD